MPIRDFDAKDVNDNRLNIIMVSLFAILFVLICFCLPESEMEKSVKSGEKILTCEFSDGWRDVPSEKIVGYNDETGYWSFTNGYAKNCEVQ